MKTMFRGARPCARRSGVVAILAGLCLSAIAGEALCQEEIEGPDGAVIHAPLDSAKEVDRAARFFFAGAHDALAKGCFDGWDDKALAALRTKAFEALTTAKNEAEAAKTKATADAQPASDALDKKKKEHRSADDAVRKAEADLSAALVRKEDADKAVAAGGPGLQKAAEELKAARDGLEAASRGLAKARADLADAVMQESVARQALDAEQAKGAKAVAAAAAKLEEARREVKSVVAKITARSPGGFESYLEDKARVSACATLRDEFLVFESGTPTTAAIAEEATEKKGRDVVAAKEAAETARAQDLLRKASPLASVLGTGNGFVELGGAPDRAIFSIMGALGAEQKTTGTQVVMTLGLSTLFGLSDEKRLKLEAPLRNLFLRTSLPLSVTTADPLVGEGDAGAADAGAADAEGGVSRMSFVLGTSLFDDSDPRLFGTNRDCYQQVIAYEWNALDFASAEARRRQRAESFDVCNRRAAERQKLALRGGVGFLTEDGDTKLETFGAVAVWAPTSNLHFNGIYQRLFLPEPRHSFGGGFSFAGNLGGDAPAGSGVDAWARLGLDVLVLGVFDDATKAVDTEVRIQGTVKVKLANNVLSFGIGPRLLGSALSDPGVLATVALSYDADALIDPLLQPAPAPAAKGP